MIVVSWFVNVIECTFQLKSDSKQNYNVLNDKTKIEILEKLDQGESGFCLAPLQ